jgi:hypothetical protein
MKKLLFGHIAMLAAGALALPGAATAKDRDHDGLPDRWEKRHGLSTNHNSAGRDNDRDKVDNRNELRERTDPRDRDSDNDRKPDGAEDPDRDKLKNSAEDATGNDPVDPDTDNDGVKDGREHAGVIQSFEEGLLTVDLSNGDVLHGWVTGDTRVKCISEHAAEKEYAFKIKARGAIWDEAYPDEELPVDEPSEGEDVEEDVDEDLDEDADEPKDEGEYEDKPQGNQCSADWLDPGRRVRQARLALTPDGLVFEKIELVK